MAAASAQVLAQRPDPGRVVAILALLLAVAVVVAIGVGAVSLSPGQVLAALARRFGLELPWPAGAREETIVWSLRLPRVALAVVVGAGLAGAGAALQGLVRNALADPALVGVSNGAAAAAVTYIVLGAPLAMAAPVVLQPWLLPAAAFAGALLATGLAVTLARRDGRVSPAALILAGVGVASLCGAGVGLLLFVADDAELRSVTFWSLGSLGAASWPLSLTVAAPVAVALLVCQRHAADLDRLLLGELEARHLGVEVERVSRRVILAVAIAVGASVAACGVIGFVGLVVPHLVRGWLGPSHRALLPASALGGALLMVCGDVVARTVVAPAELPVGIVTALVGAPVLLAMVVRGRADQGIGA
jgi:iron complex transport system permease protein